MDEIDVCRLCLSENVDMYDINDYISEDTTYSEFARQIINLQETSTAISEASRFICVNCSEFCQEILKFRFLIISSNEHLLERENEVKVEDDLDLKNYIIEEEIIEESLIDSDHYNPPSDTESLNVQKPQEKSPKQPKRKYQKKGTFECEICQKNFISESLLERHDVLHSNMFEQMEDNIEDINRCLVCNEKFESEAQLNSHIKEHKKTMKTELTIDCQYCEKSHCNYSSLIRHLNTHEENKTLKCTECDKKFAPGSQELIDHLNMHKGFAPNVCDVCGKSFMRRNRLLTHQKTHQMETEQEQPEFSCTQCEKHFKTSASLKHHMKTHGNERSFSCTLCPSKFFHKGNLKSHMTSVHSDERPFKCQLCDSSFSLSYVLKNHVNRVHGGERSYQCEYCERKFMTSDHLRRHTRTHTGEKPYKCEYCSRSFTQNGDLNKHKRLHVGECTYKCDQPGCDKAFRLMKQLRNHYQDHL